MQSPVLRIPALDGGVRPVKPPLCLAVLGASLVWALGRAPAPSAKEPMYLSLMLPSDQQLGGGGIAISPDGRDLVYSAVAEEGPPGPEGDRVCLYHRRLSSDEPGKALPGTNGAILPFFSPDGAWVGFASPSDLTRKKIPLAGGGPVPLIEGVGALAGDQPGFWSADGSILFGDVYDLWLLPLAPRGKPKRLPWCTKAREGMAHLSPDRRAATGRGL